MICVLSKLKKLNSELPNTHLKINCVKSELCAFLIIKTQYFGLKNINNNYQQLVNLSKYQNSQQKRQ